MKFLAMSLLFVLPVTVSGQFGKDKGTTKPPSPPPLKGTVVEKKTTMLPKFEKPIPHVPHNHPPDKAGGSWHWHEHHGWMWFRQGFAPQTVIVPANFALPPSVFLYETTAQPVTVVCPHCGKPFAIYP